MEFFSFNLKLFCNLQLTVKWCSSHLLQGVFEYLIVLDIRMRLNHIKILIVFSDHLDFPWDIFMSQEKLQTMISALGAVWKIFQRDLYMQIGRTQKQNVQRNTTQN